MALLEGIFAIIAIAYFLSFIAAAFGSFFDKDK